MIKVGIIGSGNMAFDMAHAFSNHPDFKIKTICDIDEAKAKRLASSYDCQPATDFHEVLADQGIDLIYIATPPHTHAEIFLKSMAAKKHTFCEKPLSISRKETEVMLEAAIKAQKLGIVSAINYPMAFIPALKTMKELLPKAGLIRHAELKLHFPSWPRPGLSFGVHDWINSKENGGILREISCHYLYALDVLFPDSIQRVCSLTSYPTRGAETGVSGIIEHQGFSTNVSGSANFCGDKEEIFLKIFGSEMSLSLENFQILKVSAPKGLKTHESSLNIDEQAFMSSVPVVKELALAINKQPSKLSSIATGARIQKLLDSLIESNGRWL